MSRAVAVIVALGAGCLVGIQPPVNARLGASVGKLQAATVSFLIGAVVLVLLSWVLARGGLGAVRHVGTAPWWALTGGLLGAVYVAVSLITVRTLGATGLVAAVIAGQLAVSLAVDRFGLLGIARQPIGVSRLVGLVLLVAGVVLVVRR
ncbi:MAG: DMT family transporter [Acidobacteriota bacterium]|nr:DMT family transporter [Acidobacteriota bacterium]